MIVLCRCYRALFYFSFLLVLFCAQHTSAQVTISSPQSALALAQKLAGPGVTILNPVLTCDPYGVGVFKVTSSNLGLDSGILLTNGYAGSVSGAAYINASSNMSLPGDPQLAQLAGSSTFDACKLEFDIIPRGDTVKFDYIFGSEEYNNATCGPYNDAFSFFISGPGITGQVNMALVPGTNIPVAVNSINNGIPGSQGNIANCTAMGPGSPFTSYYVNNTGGTTITYKGFTKVLKAVHAVQPCGTYHLKLTIADAGNATYDSGVFIKAGSLTSSTFTITASNAISIDSPVIAKGCLPATVTVKRSGTKNTPQTLKYQIGGNAVNGTDYTFITDSVTIPAYDSQAQFSIAALLSQYSPSRSIRLYLISPTACNGQEIIDSTFIALADVPFLNITTPDTTICKGAGISLMATGSQGLKYSWQPASSLSNPSMAAPVAHPSANTLYKLTGFLPRSGCPALVDSINVAVVQPPVINAGVDQSVCTGASVQFSASVSSGYNYIWTGPASFTDNAPVITIPNVTTANSGTYIVNASDGVCTVTDSVLLSVNAIPPAPTVISPFVICLHGEKVAVYAGGQGLLWYTVSLGGTGTAIAPAPSTEDTLHVRYYVSQGSGGCESSRAAIDIAVEKCCGDELIIPSAFTPNGDGRNETFGISNVAANLSYHLRVFNRWGEMVYHGIKGDRWDGSLHGRPAQAGVYFYDIIINCAAGNVVDRKGEVTLVR